MKTGRTAGNSPSGRLRATRRRLDPDCGPISNLILTVSTPGCFMAFHIPTHMSPAPSLSGDMR